MERYFAVGDEVMVFGKLRQLKPRIMDHPETEILVAASDHPADVGQRSLHIDRIVPVYGLTEGIAQRWLRGLVWRALEKFGGQIPEPHAGLDAMDLPTHA